MQCCADPPVVSPRNHELHQKSAYVVEPLKAEPVAEVVHNVVPYKEEPQLHHAANVEEAEPEAALPHDIQVTVEEPKGVLEAPQLKPIDSHHVAAPPPATAAKKLEKKAGESREYDATEHRLSLPELMKAVDTHIDLADPTNSRGLSNEEAAARLRKYGYNEMKPPKKKPEIIKYLEQYCNLFMILLEIACVLSFVAWAIQPTPPVNMYCGIALIVIVVGQCSATYLEERKSGSVMDKLKNMVPSQTTVVRNGQMSRIAARELVVGDLVKLKGGDRVPADLRIIQTSGLKVECSSLTGEPDAFEVTVTLTHEEPHETRNITFNTSQCTEGAAYGVVIRTGDNSLIGMVASLASATKTGTSTLQAEIHRIVLVIIILAFCMAVVILIIGIIQAQQGKIQTVVVINLVITIFVANIPEGLPATVTVCLGIAAKRMFLKHVLVKNLEIIETLGSASCIASDKTGTLTQNKMSVQNFWFNGQFEMLGGKVNAGPNVALAANAFDAGNRSDAPSRVTSSNVFGGDLIGKQMFQRWKANSLEPLLLIAGICNSAKFAAAEGPAKSLAEQASEFQEVDRREARNKPGASSDAPKKITSRQSMKATLAAARTGKEEIIGDASEAALMRYCDQIMIIEKLREVYTRVFEVPFNSTNKYSLCVTKPPLGEAPGKQYIMLKGAPEIVITRCNRWLVGGVVKPMDDEFKTQFQAAYERFAMGGERVLGFAQEIIDELPAHKLNEKEVPARDLVFMGLISLMDPPKNGVDQAVLDCHRAGIRVFMVTGDHALTAEAIAHSVNIITLHSRADLAHDRGVPIAQVDPRDPEIEAVVVTGGELKSYDENDWQWLLAHEEVVFARTTPQQKLEIVEHLQARSEIVAVTGDGVNDSPALKKADIGVAMGSPNASDVAREAADIIILDDDFCSIVHAIREGRLLFDNLKKSVAYIVTHLLPEILPVLLNIILLFPLGLGSMLILTIDLGSELLPGVSLAFEEPESSIMDRRPRNPKTDRMITKQLVLYSYCIAGVLEAGFSILAFFAILWSYGISLSQLCLPSDSTWFTYPASGNDNLPCTVGATFGMHCPSKGYLTDFEQYKVLSKGNAAVYANIVLCQMFHIWFCRTRATSIFKHNLFQNKVVLASMVYELVFIAIMCYIPQLSTVFVSGYGLNIAFWFFSLCFALCILVWTEWTKYHARRNLEGADSCLGNIAW